MGGQGPPRPVQALEVSACGPSDGFYAGGLYAEGTEVAKGEQIGLLSLKSVILRKWFYREHLFYIMAAGFQRLCHQMGLSIKVRWITPEVTLSRCQQTRGAKILHSHLQLSNGQAVGPSSLDVLGIREAQI